MARILALEPYYGGSHQAFLDGWMRHSRHTFTLLPLKAHHWKWRMRHAAVTLAEQSRALGVHETFDLIWCSSMCNLAEFSGLCAKALRHLPLVAYFHENQLAYPSQHTDPRDVHFAFTNWTTALCATEVWFNSAYNRDSFIAGLHEVFQKLPDHRDAFEPQAIIANAKICPPGIDECSLPAPLVEQRPESPFHIAWAARFEHDKGPEVLLGALELLRRDNVQFELSIMGQQFAACPSALAQIERDFKPQLRHFGFEPERTRYLQRLASADVFVSTAHHEFFGLAVLEAAQAGCSLLLPRRLSYPELFQANEANDQPLFYDGSAADLVRHLKQLAHTERHARPEYRSLANQYVWPNAATTLDDAIDAVLTR